MSQLKIIKAVAVDDEPVALDIIRQHAENIDFIDLQEAFFSATKALAYIRRETIQLVFLDIQMPDLSGIELAGIIGQEAQIIFTTAYAEHALEAFNLAATDYLLKPITYDRFRQACILARTRLAAPIATGLQKETNLFLKEGYKWKKINIDDLLYAEGLDNYVRLVEEQQKSITRITLNELLNRLPDNRFLRVHKSFIVAIAKIDKFDGNHVIIAGRQIPVSQSYKERLLQSFNHR
jgi:two-component system LytT family response regulator